MFLRLESISAVPLYRQIVDQIRYEIANGSLRPGDRLPSVRELARQLPVNQNTVLKAYDLLERDGLIVRRQGEGTFVDTAPPVIKKVERLRQMSAILAQAAAQAVHFEIDGPELHELLEREIRAITRGGQEPPARS